jgi:hypothetical protein
MALVPTTTLPDENKLLLLQRLDQFRAWSSLEDKRYCLICGTIITGRDIRVIGGTRGNGPVRVICPTERCNSIPMDWVLPTAEVLAKSSRRPVAPHKAGPTEARPRPSVRGLAESLRKLASHFRRSS